MSRANGELCCSFCGKTAKEVSAVVKNADSSICNECVIVALDVLFEKGHLQLNQLPLLSMLHGGGMLNRPLHEVMTSSPEAKEASTLAELLLVLDFTKREDDRLLNSRREDTESRLQRELRKTQDAAGVLQTTLGQLSAFLAKPED